MFLIFRVVWIDWFLLNLNHFQLRPEKSSRVLALGGRLFMKLLQIHSLHIAFVFVVKVNKCGVRSILPSGRSACGELLLYAGYLIGLSHVFTNIGARIALTPIFSRFFCEFWSGLGFPYLHGAWYITTILALDLSFKIIIRHHYTSIINHDTWPIRQTSHR